MADNTTYGKAQSRFGHFPIAWRTLPKGESGVTNPKPDLQTIFKNPSEFLDAQPQIQVDPNQQSFGGGLSNTINHEVIHRLLASSGTAAMQAASDQPNYSIIANAFAKLGRAGNPQQEIPASAFSNDPDFQKQADPYQFLAFKHGFSSAMQKINPATVKIMLSMPGNS